jgi:hypothetical protein
VNVETLKNILLLREASRIDFPVKWKNPVRIGEWVMVTDGWCFLAIKSEEQVLDSSQYGETILGWINKELSNKALPMIPFKQFVGRRRISNIDGHCYDMDILADFLPFVESNSYRYAHYRQEPMPGKASAHSLHLGGDDWRIVLMGKAGFGFAETFAPEFEMGG